jgi:hypothetical protein
MLYGTKVCKIKPVRILAHAGVFMQFEAFQNCEAV